MRVRTLSLPVWSLWVVPQIMILGLLMMVPLARGENSAGPRSLVARRGWWKMEPALVKALEMRLGPDIGLRGVPDTVADEEIEVLVRARAGSDLSPHLSRRLVRPFVDPLGLQLVIGRLRLANLEKLLACEAVVQVQLPESPLDPPRLEEPGPAGKRPEPGSPDKDWFEVSHIHRSRAAWENGYTGQGVKVMVNDSGIDFCHPDLDGTWATVDQPASPYHGWPLMFDSYSMYLLARDQAYGEQNLAAGRGDYADTSATCSSNACQYQPLNAANPYSYTLPATSRSGTYHLGSHPDHWLDWEGEGRAAVLVVDEQSAGVYDTVYVDLDHNHDFRNDSPARRSSPTACGTYGSRDYSGGLVYFIADGVHPVPAGDWLWQLSPPDNGCLVAFAVVDFVEPGGSNHGQICASAVAAQGVINGGAPAFKPPYAGPGDGVVLGAARDAKLVSNGNTFQAPAADDAYLFAALGYDGQPNTNDDSQIVTNSFGSSSTANDGWDLYSRMVDAIQLAWGPSLSIVFAAGNGAPGYGTLAPPIPHGGITVGASTEFGSAGQDGIRDGDRITWGDMAPFSDRGPSAQGGIGIHVVAGGARGTGLVAVNERPDDVAAAWGVWGGTSRACPTAGGNLALVYDAYRQAHGSWPSYLEARALLMAGARSLNYDPLIMGAGMVDAERSTTIAAGTHNGGGGGLYTLPAVWNAGDYRGATYPAFANLVFAATSSTQTFTVSNTGAAAFTASLSARHLVKSADDVYFSWTTGQVSDEGEYDPDKPDYLREISDLIPPGTDLFLARIILPLSELDSDGDYQYDSRWTLLAYDWSDDGDGQLWHDFDHNGVVNSGELDPDDQYVRFVYDSNCSTTKAVVVQRPLERMHDGIYLGLVHGDRSPAIPQSHFQVRLEFYSFAAWDWVSLPESVSVPASGQATFDARLEVPAATPAGIYQGTVLLEYDGHLATIPVAANVAVELADEPIELAGAAANDPTLRYNNGVVQGHFSWSWRADSGDWRFFFIDVPEQPAGARLMVHTTWDDEPGLTDLDTLIFGPVAEPDFGDANLEYFGPYTLGIIGGSPNRNVEAGVWLFDTSSGGHEDFNSAPLVGGLHVIAIHNVLTQGHPDGFDVPFTVTVGRLLASPADLLVDAHASTGEVPLALTTEIPLAAIEAAAFGLSCPPTPISGEIAQDAISTHTIAIADGGVLEVVLDGHDLDDLDLFLFDPQGNRVATSASGAADERVRITRPEDGDWQAMIHGYRIMDGTSPFELTINAIQGTDITVVSVGSGPFAAGDTIPVELAYTLPEGECTPLSGILVYGPPGGNRLAIPLTVDVLLSDHIALVPGIAHSPGAQASAWRSNLAVVNRGHRTAEMLLSFRPNDFADPSINVNHRLGPGATIEWADVLVSCFGLDEQTSARGVVQIGADSPLAITARTYNQTEQGSFGQYLPALTADDGLGEGVVGVIPQLKKTSAFRTNVAALNLGATSCDVAISLYRGDSSQVGTTATLTVLPGRYQQADDIFGSGHTAAGSQEIAYATVTVVTPGGTVWAFASLVDNATGDPTTIGVRRVQEGPYQVAGVAHAPGSAGTQWRTNLAVVNRNPGAAELELTFYPYDPAAEPLAIARTVAAGATAEWEDLLVSQFGLAVTEAFKGTLHIAADHPLAIAARTYNQTVEGTLGQYLPALTAAQALGPGDFGLIPQLKRTADFRSNLGLLNLGPAICQVTIRLHRETGQQVGADVGVTLAPGRYWQGDDIFGAAYSGAGRRELAYATVTVETADGQVWAYGSVVDNASGDPTTIPILVEGPGGN